MRIGACVIVLVSCDAVASLFGKKVTSGAKEITDTIMRTGISQMVFYAPGSEFCYYDRIDAKIIANPAG